MRLAFTRRRTTTKIVYILTYYHEFAAKKDKQKNRSRYLINIHRSSYIHDAIETNENKGIKRVEVV